MNAKTILSLSLTCILALACAKPVRIVWTEGATDPETGKTVHTMTIQNPPKGTDWTIWFSQFRTPVTMKEGAKADILHHGGTLYRIAPTADAGGKEMVLDYEARALVNQCRAPEGFYLQKKGQKPVPVEAEYVFLPAEPVHTFDYSPADLTVYDMVPRLKKILADGGYRGEELKEMVRKTLGCKLEVVLRPDESPKKFNVIPLRWIVERSFAWLYNFRRIALDYEFYSESSEAMIQIAFSKIMLNKLSN